MILYYTEKYKYTLFPRREDVFQLVKIIFFASKNPFHHEDSEMLTADEILKKIEKNKEKIKKFGVKRIGLFGSYIRDEQKIKSDIDILVEFERGKKTFDNYMDLKFFLEDLFKCKVDLVIADALKTDLKPIILSCYHGYHFEI